MDRLVRASGLAVSALVAATGTILLLLPGRAQLEYPQATAGTSDGATVTSAAIAPGGNGVPAGASASEHGQGLTVSGRGRPSRLSSAGDGWAGPPSTPGGHHARPGEPGQPALPPLSPGTGAQADADNAGPVAPLSLWLSDWTPPAQPPRQNCSGGLCAVTGGGWDGPNLQINGDHFNFGPVMLQIRRSNGAVLWSTTVTARSYPGFAGAALYAQTPIGDCSGVPGTIKDGYAIAYDPVSGRWSGKVPLDSGCRPR